MEKLYLEEGEADRLRQKYPNKIPVFVEKAKNSSTSIPDLKKHKFLVPSHLSVGQFIWVIRKQIQLSSEKALFIFVNNTLPTSNTLISELYSAHKSSDGALRIKYTSENTFGFTTF
jgi:GABA(A) receptor-associated protein